MKLTTGSWTSGDGSGSGVGVGDAMELPAATGWPFFLDGEMSQTNVRKRSRGRVG